MEVLEEISEAFPGVYIRVQGVQRGFRGVNEFSTAFQGVLTVSRAEEYIKLITTK